MLPIRPAASASLSPFRRLPCSRQISLVLPRHNSTTGPRPSEPPRQRTKPQRELPRVKSQVPFFLTIGVLGVSAWAGFVLYATNQERLSSSVMRQILHKLRDAENSAIAEVLGVGIAPEPAWYMAGDPWISGAINLLQGNVDLSFRVKGSKGSGTVYFTSIREAKGRPFKILRFKIICDDGRVISLKDDAGA
ncbi:hypothetical protein BOTBODRAFT_32912 [Botryobasidium botryosum FD-172 SS1]|uniref:DUF1783-domain-containing protein n=1 Tax=Botryobasidium botryosum (strain FD-172 SS1) TaxID=930990 RepID=A0A067MEY8_BOTB1|nr:hypothetical protein BOTBODRAFT_32912 [Botryobasidium botryosum FD-172 SS1]